MRWPAASELITQSQLLWSGSDLTPVLLGGFGGVYRETERERGRETRKSGKMID